ncbi:ABC transporter ATP-binding protein [Streptomyces sp. NPDC054884]|uniref:ABC transporter ATP-binding protein n=1 Tax=Streptomyces sp. ME08-AFT2 TaxID=3028683 RepID=UPI0029AF427B|nr:ABC transporter ATP-binding protein [Streptomyces sp. ME08-AFT2]MDX3314491.1 ABC transporter ATP-binding protein [Streptomyces sp. ME08-AFT2]
MARTGSPSAGRTHVRFDDNSITRQRIKRGTVRRILPYAMRHRWSLALLLLVTMVHAAITATSPLILKMIIDDGILPGRTDVVVWLCIAVACLTLLDAVTIFVQAWCSGRVGQGLVYDLRTRVFGHVQEQPLAFFTRAQTGSLVSRLNADVIGARDALTALLIQSVSTVLTLILVLVAMFYLSWQIALAALVMVPFFLFPARLIARRLQRLSREAMQLDAEMSSMMSERFNVAGAMLAKLYGRSSTEADLFADKAGRVRDVVAVRVVYGRMLFIIITVLTGITTALVYGLGGSLTIDGTLQLGTLVAMVALLLQLYGPINQLSTMQVTVMTALVSFDRVFEVLDLKPLIAERTDARALPAAAPDAEETVPLEIEFDQVRFRYPHADEVSLASLESIALRRPEKATKTWVLQQLSFRAPAGKLTALVGPSGAGKTTISQLVPRLYDPTEGAVRIAGHDIRELTLQSLRDTVGVVTQDAHLFHDTLRANLAYARPCVTEEELIAACEAALIWDTVTALPDGLDTVVGDRGYRLSGGEKQRIALARLLIKAPPIVVLDEATAHLDSESEAAIQRALKTALAGRTSLVIAHRLSTIREADQILVVEAGRIRECGTHDELLAAGGLYADLYDTQFAQQSTDGQRATTRKL